MKFRGFAAAVLLCLTGQAAAAPQRIMSLKVCTDELLLDLVPAQQIASITFLSREKASLRQWPQAASIPVNHGTAEEILATHPDLILTDPFIAPALRPLLGKTGAKIVEVPAAENFDQIRSSVRLVAKAVDQEVRGEALIARMDATLRDLKSHRPEKTLTVAEWGGGGYVPGRGGLFNALLEAAGAHNVEQGSFGYYDVESLIAKNPDALVFGDTYQGTASLRVDQDQHPALMKRYAGKRINYAALFGCGVPESADVARQLHDALRRVQK
ncbi:MAG TPA: ABC transporter substrate-binding protein [Rhizomicrobium sp.]|nr:ABC transporter substrate-binding protein [Rhizomicrobium sp.]